MTIRELLAKRGELVTEMRSLNDASNGADFTPEQQARFDTLRSEADQLERQIQNRAALDENERRMGGGTPLAGGGDARLASEMRSFSVTRALAAAAGLNVDAGRERELTREMERRSGRSFKGVGIPLEALAPVESRVVMTTNPVTGPGANLISDVVRGDLYAPMIRERSVLRRAGARYLTGLVGNVRVPFAAEGPTAFWVEEDEALTLSDVGFGALALSPHHVGGVTEISRDMLLQSSPDVEQLVREELSATVAAAVDDAAINGSGVYPIPLGLAVHTGIAETTGPVTAATLLAMMGAVEDAGFTGGTFLARGSVIRGQQLALRSAGLPGYVADDAGQIMGVRTEKSAHVPGDVILYGDLSELFVGLWGPGVDVLANPYAERPYLRGNVQLRAMASVDVGIRRVGAMARHVITA